MLGKLCAYIFLRGQGVNRKWGQGEKGKEKCWSRDEGLWVLTP